MTRLKILILSLGLSGLNLAAATIFLDEAQYEVVGKKARGCPEGNFREILSEGKTLLLLGSSQSIQLQPENDQEQATEGCHYTTQTTINKNILTHISTRTKCPEAGQTIETLTKVSAERMDYRFTNSGPKVVKKFCRLKKLKETRRD